MEKEDRLNKIISILEETSPVSGGNLANKLGVTRQVIVQDVAVLRSRGYDIISTARGYILNAKKPKCTRLIAVRHDREGIAKELSLIVENGGEVLDVIVEHPIYGELRGILNIKTIDDVKVFVSIMESSNAEPLLSLSHGVHLHTIGASSEDILNKIEEALIKAGFVI
ncbi:MAG: transcription repressor NadR [Caldisericaceae bacterium]